MVEQQSVLEHYGVADLRGRVEDILKQAGLGGERLDWWSLAPLDQFHVRGVPATKELAEGLHVTPGTTLLDVGCGLGGPARYLAAECGCLVTGIDLNPAFIDVAKMLAERTGLADRITFQQGNALDMPFADDTFDTAWTQHVAMNISDRAGLYKEVHRVLAPNGLFAIYDVAAGNGQPLEFPLPWARTPDVNFLLTPDEMRKVLSGTGFAVQSWDDTTEAGVAWFEEMASAPQPPPIGLQVIIGPDFPVMIGNLVKALKDGRLRLVQAILRKE